MKFAHNTDFPSGNFVIHIKGNQTVVVMALSLTCSSGNDDAEVYHLRAITLPMDQIDEGGMVVLVDPGEITRIEQISDQRYAYLKELTSRRAQIQNIESALQMQKAAAAGKQSGVLREIDDASNDAQQQNPDSSPSNEPFVPKTVPLEGGHPSRDEEVADHENTLMEVPPPPGR